jgi:uncharacterized protein
MYNFRVVFIHGYTASSKADWYPEISKELDRFGVDYVIPDLPGGEHPHAEEWLRVLQSVIGQSSKPLVLVGHSLGSRAALLYLERFKPKVKLVLLIAAFANSIDNAERNDGEAYPDFFTHVINLKLVRPLSQKFIVVHSRDDSSIPYTQGVSIAVDLHAQLSPFNDRDHFYDPTDAPIILEMLRKELKF